MVFEGIKKHVKKSLEERAEERRIYNEEFKKAKVEGLKIRARNEGRATGLGTRSSGIAAFFEVPARGNVRPRKGQRVFVPSVNDVVGPVNAIPGVYGYNQTVRKKKRR